MIGFKKRGENMRQTMGIVAAVLVFVAFVCVTNSAKATVSITDVYIMPEVPAVEDIITIFASGSASQSSSWVDHTEFSMVDTSLQLDLFLDMGNAFMVSYWSYSEEISPLPAGTYTLTVRAFGPSYVPPYYGDLEDTYTVDFTVVPEPATFLFLVMGIVAVREGHCRNNVNFRTSRDIQEEGA